MKLDNSKKCPNCGGEMVFDPDTGKMFCASCGSKQWIKYKDFKQELTSVKSKDVDEMKERAVHHYWMFEGERAICKNCGGEVHFNLSDNTVQCPYCDSNLVVKDLEKKTIAPDGIIPFKISEKDARAAFENWVDRSFLCPKEVKRIVRKEEFQGIYLPCWTFDVETQINCRGTYKDKKRIVDFDENGTKSVKDKSIVATDKYEEEYIRKVYPFKTERNKPYKDEYVAGFMSEKYTISIIEAWEREMPLIEKEVKKEAEREIKLKYVEFQDVEISQISVHFGEPQYKYLLIPVWLSEFEYKGTTFEFAVNGESGKVAGELPVAKRNRNIAIVLGVIVTLLCLRYAKTILLIGLVIVLLVTVGLGALVWYIRKNIRKNR